MSQSFPITENDRDSWTEVTPGQTVFGVDFPFQLPGDLRVSRVAAVGEVPVELTLDLDYTVTGAGSPAGGAVHLAVAPPSGTFVWITGLAPATRTTNITRAGRFNPAAMEEEFDRNAIRDMELRRDLTLERSERIAADAALGERIDTERAERIAADEALEAADIVLQANIDGEAGTRAAADAVLQANIDALEVSSSAALEAEQAARIAADAALQVAVDDLDATKAEKSTPVTGTGLARVTATLAAPIVIDVPKASPAAALAGELDDVAVTPATAKIAIDDRFGPDFYTEEGQTAVSTIASLDGVPLIDFDRDGVMSTPDQTDFYTEESDGTATALISSDGAMLLGWDSDGRLIGATSGEVDFYTEEGDARSALVSSDGAELLKFDQEGNILTPELTDFYTEESDGVSAVMVSSDGAELLKWDEDGKLVGSVNTELDFYTEEGGPHTVLTSSDGAVLREWPGDDAPASGIGNLQPYVSGTQLRAIGGGSDYLLFDMGDIEVLATHAVSPDYVAAVIDRPSIGPGTLILAKPGERWWWPGDDKVLRLKVGTGQSLKVAQHSSINPTLTGQTRPGAWMFTTTGYSDVRMGRAPNAVTEFTESYLVGFEPLTPKAASGSSIHVETMMESLAFRLSDEFTEAFPDREYGGLYIVSAQGGTAYTGLKKGTAVYNNMLTAVTRAKLLAPLYGYTSVLVEYISVKHGEADAGNVSYKDNLIEWRADYDADIRAITGQTAPVHFIMQMPSSDRNGDAGHYATKAMLDLHNESPYFHVSGADYPYLDEYYVDAAPTNQFLHLTGPGTHFAGEYVYLAERAVFGSRFGKGQIVQMVGATITGLDVELQFSTPYPPLVFDTTTISERDWRGIVIRDSAGDYAVASGSITDDGSTDGIGRMTLTLAAAPTGTGLEARVARSNHPGGDINLNPRTAATVPRSNIRDSAPFVSTYDGSPLHNWAVPQIFPIT
ncbi:hypothetical protein [Ancylobacter oerskovii]|uniref:Uncharacterized protein n=1 Tax=Ancylobacter oerskovii TaxID=459519 RepID=A0ABW4YR52_9HYPH|nr:hypothetical protein [Ancylobacter oerskovii]MBS7545694.1 hypothetical protein [Ancylobacter oerskovii]